MPKIQCSGGGNPARTTSAVISCFLKLELGLWHFAAPLRDTVTSVNFPFCFKENKSNQPTKTTKRSRKPGKALQMFASEVMQHIMHGAVSGQVQGQVSPWSCGWIEDPGLHHCQASHFPQATAAEGFPGSACSQPGPAARLCPAMGS